METSELQTVFKLFPSPRPFQRWEFQRHKHHIPVPRKVIEPAFSLHLVPQACAAWLPSVQELLFESWPDYLIIEEVMPNVKGPATVNSYVGCTITAQLFCRDVKKREKLLTRRVWGHVAAVPALSEVVLLVFAAVLDSDWDCDELPAASSLLDAYNKPLYIKPLRGTPCFTFLH